jgi:hypothetical protein
MLSLKYNLLNSVKERSLLSHARARSLAKMNIQVNMSLCIVLTQQQPAAVRQLEQVVVVQDVFVVTIQCWTFQCRGVISFV